MAGMTMSAEIERARHELELPLTGVEAAEQSWECDRKLNYRKPVPQLQIKTSDLDSQCESLFQVLRMSG